MIPGTSVRDKGVKQESKQMSAMATTADLPGLRSTIAGSLNWLASQSPPLDL